MWHLISVCCAPLRVAYQAGNTLAMIRQSRPTLLLTRPMAQSLRFAADAALRFPALPQVLSPLLAARFLPVPTPSAPYGGVIFTSETGVEGAVRAGIAPQLAYCVGAQTAKAAQSAGFDAISAGGDWRDLTQLIITAQPKAALLFLAAQEAPNHLQNALAKAGLSVERANVYAQDPVPFSASALALLAQDQPVLVPLFSPRSAQVFCAAAHGLKAPLWVAALSDNVAAALTLPVQRIITAHRPNSAAMLDAIGALIEKPST